MKKLYIVYKHYDYDEGNSEPIAVCSSRRRAEKYKDCEIIELELNKPIHKPLQYISLPISNSKNPFDLPDFVFRYPPSRGRGLLDLMDKATSAQDTDTFSWLTLDRTR